MTVWPLVERELRSAARQRFSYWLRLIGACSLLLAAALFGWQNGFVQSLGGKLFGALHLTLFAAIWLFVPYLTADCISRERREGTLGLLLLARVKPWEIVVAKSFTQILRAMTLWLAVLPIMAVPFLLGGVSWRESLLSVCVNLSSVFLALAAGLLGSSLSRVWSRVLVWVGCLSLLLCIGFVLIHFVVVVLVVTRGVRGVATPVLKQILGVPFFDLLTQAFGIAADGGGMWSEMVRLTPAQKMDWLEAAALMTAGSAIVFCLAIGFVSWRVRRCWREQEVSSTVRWLLRTFCRPVFFQNLLRRWMKHKLQRNPIGWLEQRSWSGRLIGWVWLGLVMGLACPALLLSEPFHDSRQISLAAGSIMAIGLALSAAGSFRRERETGVLELLLVSPLREGQLLSGRVCGLWMQFLPGAILLVLTFGFISALGLINRWGRPSEFEIAGFTISTFLSLPIIGLYFSLRFRSFPAALLGTVGAAIVAPLLMATLPGWIRWAFLGRPPYYEVVLPSFGALPWQILLAGISLFLLWRRLKKRDFPQHASGV